MEFCQGNLRNFIDDIENIIPGFNKSIIEPVEFKLITQIFLSMVECANYLHQLKPPIIHCDLKPENFLFSERETKINIVLCDFGLSKVQENLTISTMNNPGTSKYMPQETVGMSNSKHRYSTKFDVYSLGIICNELFGLK